MRPHPASRLQRAAVIHLARLIRWPGPHSPSVRGVVATGRLPKCRLQPADPAIRAVRAHVKFPPLSAQQILSFIEGFPHHRSPYLQRRGAEELRCLADPRCARHRWLCTRTVAMAGRGGSASLLAIFVAVLSSATVARALSTHCVDVEGLLPPEAAEIHGGETDRAQWTATPSAEVDALKDIYKSTNGAGWSKSTNWLNGGDPCSPCAWPPLRRSATRGTAAPRRACGAHSHPIVTRK